MGLYLEKEVVIPISYKDICLESNYRVDLIVEKQLVVELKAVEQMLPVHKAQLLSYLKLGGYELGLLINFNVPRLVEGVKRIIYTSESL